MVLQVGSGAGAVSYDGGSVSSCAPGNVAVSGGADMKIKVWSLEGGGEEVATLQCDVHVSGLVASPRGLARRCW